MSATVPRLLLPPFPSPPVPGFVEVVQPVSCVPKPAVKGVPRFSPWPGMVRQFTPEPGKLKYFAAMLPEGAKAANAGVSYQPFEMLVCALGLRTVSQAKNANTLFFQIGPPPLAPN